MPPNAGPLRHGPILEKSIFTTQQNMALRCEPHQSVAIVGNPADAMLQRRAEALWDRNARVARVAHARENARLRRREPGIEPRAATVGFDQQMPAGACSLIKHLGQFV
jgi:hypothetical protein